MLKLWIFESSINNFAVASASDAALWWPDIQIRGAANLPTLENLQDETGTDINTPLIIMDGFEIDLQRLIDLNSDEVASITLLKDGSSFSPCL